MRKVNVKSGSVVLFMLIAFFGFSTISCSDDDNDGETLLL